MRTGRTEVVPELDPGKRPYRWTTCLSVGGSVPESLGCLVGGSGRVSPLHWPLWFWWYPHPPAKLSGNAVWTGEGVVRGRAKIGSPSSDSASDNPCSLSVPPLGSTAK